MGRDGFRHSRQTHKHKSRIPCPIFGESRFPGNSQIPDPVNIFIVFPIPAAYFGQIPNPENTLPDPLSTINESFDQPSFIAYSKNLESVLANSLNDDQISSQIKFVLENFAEDIKFYYLLPRMEIFKVLMKGKPNQKFFRYII